MNTNKLNFKQKLIFIPNLNSSGFHLLSLMIRTNEHQQIPHSQSTSFSIRKCRKVIITGGVAVGKSSIVNVVCEELTKKDKNWILVPEYLDVKDDGLEMLNKYFENKISVYEFQTYILNYYEWYLKNVKVSDDDIIIFERSIDDGITCFSNADNARGKLSISEFHDLFEKAKQLDEKYNIPSYILKNDFIFIPIKTVDVQKDGKLITEIINNREGENIIIGLYNTDDRCYERMLKRNREGETSSYTKQSISEFNYHYKQLYKELMDRDGEMRFVSLGKLIK